MFTDISYNENAIMECLDESDYGGDDFEDNATDDEFVPAHEEISRDSETTSSESSSESADETLSSQPCTRGRSRIRGSSVRAIRGRGSRGRGSRRRGSGLRYSNLGNSNQLSVQPEWQVKDFSPSQPQLSEPSYIPSDSTDFDHSQYFQIYIDNDLIDLMVKNTNQTSVFKTGKSIQLTEKECNIFIAVTMMMSCINYPYIRMYWEQKWRIPLIADAMTRMRFFQLRTSLKLVFDPDVTQEEKTKDRIWKVRPSLKKWNKDVRNK